MANKKISELQTRTPSLTDLILVGDPSNGFSYKCTVSALATIIETDIADGYVTLGTTQTINGAKTFSNNLTLTSVANASTDPDKFLVLNGSNVVNYRTGSEVLSDIGGQGTITLTTTGTSGAATLVGNTLNIPNYAPDLSGYVPTSRTITINGTTQDLTANRTYNVGTVTSVAASGGTGISISGSPITSSGTITITNTAPDQVVALTAGTGISISGTYPNFTITNSSPSLGGTVTSVALSAPTGFAVTGSPITSSGTLALAFDTGYSLPTTASQTNWDSAYNNMIVSAAVTGTTTKTLTLTQQDAGTITASWTDDNTDAVTSVFGRTGAVVATEGDYSLTQLSDVTITTPSTGQVLKYNGTIWVNDTDANTGTVTSVALSAPTGFSVSGSPITSSGTLALSFASGYSLPTTASQTNWDTAYTNRITSLTTTGSSGAATLISNTLNIPNYTLAGLGGISLTSLSASAPLSYNNTTGAFSISQSNTTTDGYLSSTDWNTFNSKIGGSGTSNYVPKFTATSTLGNSQIFDNGTNVGINTATPSEKLEVSGILRVSRTTSASVYLNVTAESGNIIFDARGSSDQIFHTQTLERLRIGLGGDITISTINNATIDTDKFLVSDSGVIKYRTGSEILSDIGGQGALTLTTTGTSGAATLVGNTLNIPQYSGGGGTVSGTTNYIAKFTSSTAVGDSRFFDNGTVTFLGNGDVNATPSTGIFSGTGGTGTNIAGAELRIRGGASTGNAAGGIISFYTSAGGSAGTGVNAATEIARFTTAGRLGIGTTSPANQLTVAGAGGAAYVRVEATDATLTAKLQARTATSAIELGAVSNSPVLFVTNDTERMRITSGGDLGIGTTTIGSKLQVNGNAAIGYSASTAAPTNGLQVAGSITGASNSNTFGTSSAGGFPIILNTGSGSNSIKINGRNNAPGDESSIEFFRFDAVTRVAFIQATSTFFAFATSSEAMRINSSNFLGIGTTTIGSRLQVNGGAAIGYSASTAAPTNGLIVAGNAYFGGQIASLTDVMQLKGSGNVLIAMQSTVNTQFSGMNLYNEAGTLAASFALGNSNTGSFSNHFFLGPRTASGNLLFVTGASGTTRMTMTTNGELQFTPATNTSVLSTTGAYSLTGANAQSLIDLAGTWNTTGNPTAIKLNITNTASGTGADLMELQVGGVSQFFVSKTGSGYFKDLLTIAPQTANTSAIKTDGYSLTGSNAQALLSMTGTWNTTGNPTAISLDITNTASGASAYLMDLQVGGTTQFRVTKAGAIRTAAPTSGTANDWKLGSVVNGTTAFDTTRWVEVEIGGTLYRVALVTLP